MAKARSLLNATLAATAALALTVGPFGTAANAALNEPISGDTWSDSTVWYQSSNVRLVTPDDGTYISINIDSAPKLSNGTPDYLKWRIRVSGTDGPTYAINQNPAGWTNLGTYGGPGTQFTNKYARGTTCSNCNHSFSGNMNY